MSDILNLPNNAENYYRKAQNALENNNFAEAIHLLEQSFALDADPKIFTELARLYLLIQDTDAMQKLWDHNYPHQVDRFQTESLATLYALSLEILKDSSQSLLELYQIKDHFIEQSWSTDQIDLLIHEYKQANEFEQVINKINDETDAKKLIDNILKLGIDKLAIRVKYLYRFANPSAFIVLDSLLKHSDVPHFIKSDILHYYLYQKIDKQVTLYWFSQSYVLNTNQLKEYRSNFIYKEIVNLIQDYTDQNNPNFYTELIQIFNLMVMVFYPFIEKAIPNAQDWFQIFLHYYDLEEYKNGDPDPTIVKYLETAIEEISQLTINTP
ncbi:hypothetical protein HZY91_03475 [Facklamia sp. DSM 111018]|uniref:Tetratricopeptide repeat protein n=1 Tax=Facklamia lactis TaxID=2749967 RepID=A0ABS0LPP2_9LACT|nr:hypothetical protein [Facklamia lactis]MBG9980150.1 hypothetical protein [Facklamia lactis]MBG9985952.1 hypothetical protein [Facklamia lactis]